MKYFLLYISFFSALFSTSYNTIHSSGASDNRLDLVFIGDRYFSDEIKQYEADVDNIWKSLYGEYAFWNRYKNFINVHRIDMVSVLNNPEDIRDSNNSAFGLDFNLGYWDGANDWSKAVSITDGFSLGNEITCILTNRVFGLGTALDRSSTGLIYATPWPSVIAHEIGHILGMAGDEYRTTIQEYMYDYAFNMARSSEEAAQRWGHWIGYKDPFNGFEINEPYQKEGTNFFRPSRSNGLMNHDSSGDFHAVNREQIILQLYRYVNPVDSHTETRVSVNSDHILEINVVDPDVVSIAWIIDGQIISNSSKLDLGSLDLTEDKLIYGLAWDNSLNLDYRTNDRGGWIREDEDSRTFRNISWMYKVDKSMQAHDQGGNINYLNLAMTSSTVKNFFNHTEVISNISLIDAETRPKSLLP